MSRHRFVRNLVEDDYYDGYDDDDYYDEDDYYDDHDNTNYNKSNTSSNKSSNNSSKASGSTSGPGVSSSSVKASATASATASSTTYAQPVGYAPKKAPKPAPTPASSAGVSKPPPGWGKPSAPAPATTKAASKPGISAPPVGWGKPGGSKAAAANAANQKPSSAGVSKPPPGWGKPGKAQSNPSNRSQTKAAPAVASGVMKPPAGWGKPGQSKAKPSSAPATPTKSKPASTTTPTSTSKSTNASSKWNRPIPEALRTNTTSQLSMVVLGHVDAGKSTLMGQLLIQVGQVSKRIASKTNLAWLLDEDESEREHGVTMQIGTKSFTTPKHDIIILDSPGHADYIPIMITGAAQADVAILVVPATRGEFEAGFEHGQTKEHILLARGLGVTQIIVAINKLDVIGWDQGRYEQIKHDVTSYLLQQQFGPKRIRFVPLSGLTGENVKSVSSTAEIKEKLQSWYTGPTLLEAINTFQPANRHLDKPFRFIITDMSAEGKGVAVRGRVVQGFCRIGDRCNVLPIGDAVTVSKLEHLQPPSGAGQSDSVSLDRLSIAQAGDTVEFLVTGIDVLRLSVGSLLVPSDLTFHPRISKKAQVKVVVRDALKIPIIRGSQVLFHMHSLNIPCTFSKLISVDAMPSSASTTSAAASKSTAGNGSAKPRKPRSLPSGCTATAEITLQESICLEQFAHCRALGRFVLRRGGDTIAVGIVDSVL